jgi:hypothetical protein
MLDSQGYNALRVIRNLAESIAADPTNAWTEGRAEEIAMFAAALIEREDRGRVILQEALAKMEATR